MHEHVYLESHLMALQVTAVTFQLIPVTISVLGFLLGIRCQVLIPSYEGILG